MAREYAHRLPHADWLLQRRDALREALREARRHPDQGTGPQAAPDTGTTIRVGGGDVTIRRGGRRVLP